ncbi:heme-binding protein [Brucella pseudogrignonensis]|uniref:GlcG/HbpS family heme-binding protein n=1 Tax=Brucella pseudogrignonensis TaxID=419475 RepID=UPI0028B30C32|nr:heme-binding protein [Brucella pseudogrignonensis]MDT6939526.1 heme-binding protein [Brucella pseudogrignonensis]
MSVELANTIVREAVAACFAEGYNVSTAVVGRAGVLRAVLRADNAGSHTPEAARQKAYTSSSSRMPTKHWPKTSPRTLQQPNSHSLIASSFWLTVFR